MELSSPSNTDADTSVRASRRKSGRVSKVPSRPGFSAPTSASGASKRKHTELEAQTDSADEEDEESDGQPDEEELRESRRKAKKTVTRKTASAHTLQTAIGGSLPVRSAAARAKKSKSTAADGGAEAVGGLYGEVFGAHGDVDEIASAWKNRYDEHQPDAVADVVNLLLRASGCDILVERFDIEDPDNAPNKLKDIQEEFQARNLPDYPIISKAKGAAAYKRTLVKFFSSLVRTLAATGPIYDDPDLMPNIQCWVVSMSSAAHRPFRHTATVVGLAIVDGLCEVAKDLVAQEAKLQRQHAGEQKKPKLNVGRLDAFRGELTVATQRRATIDEVLKDWSDTVFVHRYRDVDPRIRVDCMTHLYGWILLYPDVFFDGTHLRYFGWLLADPAGQTRQEVLKQLGKLYKDRSRVGGLQQFTERFRQRMVEMATQDVELSVRVAAVETVDAVREAGLLEAPDIDTIGKLIFDAEPKVRKTVVPFFAASVHDSYEYKLNGVGGREAVDEALAGHEDSDYPGFRPAWLKLKALAELLRSYDPVGSTRVEGHDLSSITHILAASSGESRFALATQALLSEVAELRDWKSMADYLLYDGASASATDAADIETRLVQECALDPKEEAILLDVLNEAVKAAIVDVAKVGKVAKPSKKEQREQQERQEATAQSLAVMIPKLLNKYGAAPASASAVLRLQRLLDLDVFQELRQDSSIFSALLDNVEKQFKSHRTKDVVSEASNALLHARGFAASEDITGERLGTIWNDTAYALIKQCLGEDLETRGAIDSPTLEELSSTVLRMANLARVADCTPFLEKPTTYVSKGRRKFGHSAPQLPIELLLELLGRGRPGLKTDDAVELVEDELVVNTISTLTCYFHWKAMSLQSQSLSEAALETLLARRDAFAERLHMVVAKRHGVDRIRIDAAKALLGLHTVFTIDTSSDKAVKHRSVMAEALKPQYETTLLGLWATVERDYARTAKKKLEEPDEDEDPEDLSESGEDDDEDMDAMDSQKAQELLLAEARLCDLAGKFVLAVIAGAADVSSQDETAAGDKTLRVGNVRKRLCRNRLRLGPNFKDVVAWMDKPVAKARAKKAATKSSKSAPAGKTPKSKEIVEEDDDDEDDEMGEEEDQDDDEALRRRGLTVDKEVSRRDVEEEEEDAPMGQHQTRDVSTSLDDD